jgi:hypothetical protein
MLETIKKILTKMNGPDLEQELRALIVFENPVVCKGVETQLGKIPLQTEETFKEIESRINLLDKILNSHINEVDQALFSALKSYINELKNITKIDVKPE